MIHSHDGDSVHLRRGPSSPVHDWLARASSIPVEEVPTELLSLGRSPRIEAGTSADHVRLLAEAESPLPAIIVHRATMRVIDGAHRLQAARAQGRPTIAVKYFDGTDDDAFALAVQANVSHGLPLSLAERKAAARRLVASHPQWSDRLIASVIGLSHKTVGVERRRSGGECTRLNSRVGRDGKVHRLTVSDGRKVAVEIIKNNPAASLREISREAGISVGTAKNVRDRLSRPGYLAAPQVQSAPVEVTSPQELILRTLRNDPALKFNDKGKVLLRRLALSFTDIRALQRHAAEAPGHTRLALAKLARANARSWLELAARLDNGLERAHPDSDADQVG
ncbi:ParB/RepB/Spo0J family partition protein [Nocardia sp. XZ_19_369]|uniref:ParB/RepB/Spo0J family partition protein n=1 Tax=Nocardia sp. XZ_19_369 TaxID=2769487 RepID=UPI001890227A|nr:ParB/RepB/Spo0J family partition protein [Nocardia sp. XZ_19_369]